MEKIKNFIKNNKGLSILLGLTLILVIIILIILLEFIREKNTNKYGDRLEGIEEVKITEKKVKKIEKTISENEEVEKVDIRIQGRIIYLNITYSNSVEVSKAKEIADYSLDNFSEKELKFYDVSCFLIEIDDNNEETEEFVITGNKHRNFDSFTYIKS